MTEPSSPRTQTAEAHHRAVERVIQALRRNPSSDFSLQAMASLALMSRFHFNRVFRQLTGVPPGYFHSALRLQAAKRLLLTTDLSVLDVCFAVGYQSPGTFNRRFNEMVGLSPQRVRRLARTTPSLLARLPELLPAPGAAGTSGIAGIPGSVAGPPDFEGLVFVGLFSRPIPQGRPAGFALLPGPGRFRMPAVPDGDYHLLAVALPAGADIAIALMDPDAGLRSRPQERRVPVRGGATPDPSHLVLRPAEDFDPPILPVLPLLLAERLGRTKKYGADATRAAPPHPATPPLAMQEPGRIRQA
ncbi:MAG: AraC family transcriptional regulator [Acidobacteriota bacterium]|jgi:AraC-like DNA-binding protein|nr:AraC family transcriptional regulator [Acidobacteriota bacterium]